MAKPVFAISISFECNAKDHDKAWELAERIGSYVEAEKMAASYNVIDVEMLDDGESDPEELDFDEGDA